MSNLSADLQEQTGTTQSSVEVRTDARLAAAVGGVASIVAFAYLARALGDGGWLDWVVVLVTSAIAAAHLQSLADARVPLLVVDEQGVRMRSAGLRGGRVWQGLPWADIEVLEHEPRRGLFGDGRITLVPRDEDDVHRSVPLSISTRVSGADDDLTAALLLLAPDADQVVETEHVGHDLRPTLARAIDLVSERLRPQHDDYDEYDDEYDEYDEYDEHEHEDADLDEVDGDDEPEHTVPLSPIVASATPIPLRDPVGGSRAEVRFDGAAALASDPSETDDETRPGLPESRELRRPGSVDLVEDTVVWSDRVQPIAREGEAVAPLVIDDFSVEPAEDPVIGPELVAARTRLGLTVDQLAERTRIRPHVIESIEVDDFAPCGGDFYARGHLRTLARILGVDAGPLLASYDERYADAPINARRVFEAELATGADGPIRSTRGGPNWSVLVAAVMALVLCWSIARLIMDSPVELHHKPVLNGSPSSQTKLGPAVPVVLDAANGGTHVVVRDGAGDVAFSGDLAYGDTKTVKAAPPVRIQSSDGSLKVTIDGQDRGPLGAEGQPAQNTFAASS
ncbi:helix-turn-helix domain-containing protein [Nocardioides sp. CN2-186]|uniref:helix-turn-helix domain-containing protein n=1 Tax=Nocardioides tweenelious TaxID=3156607 RepID=UPI0032B3B7CD